MILGLCGKKGAGKDTGAEYLLDKGWARISFADPLKDLCANVFGIKPVLFYNPEFKDLIFPTPIILGADEADNFMAALVTPVHGQEQANLIYDAFDGKEIKSARHLLQWIGTDVIRDCVSTTYWLDIAEYTLKKWQADNVNVVFTDVRFKNERDLIKDYGGTVVEIVRNTGSLDNHSSEMIDFTVDAVIENNGTIEELYNKIKELQ